MLGGCAPKQYLFEGNKPANETATLSGLLGDRFTSKTWFDVYFISVDDKSLSNAMLGNPIEVEVLAGKHSVTIQCLGYGALAYSTLEINAVAGKLYELECVDAGDNKVEVNIGVKPKENEDE